MNGGPFFIGIKLLFYPGDDSERKTGCRLKPIPKKKNVAEKRIKLYHFFKFVVSYINIVLDN